MLVSVGLAAVGAPLLQPSTVEPWNGHYSQLCEAGSRGSPEYEDYTDSRGWRAVFGLELGIQPKMAGCSHWLIDIT